ncbi:carbonic anhydrase 1 isoform X2 [Nematostella vectensis]|nr:carbonic anhydrase 1 isoform X2 [Nematostella vectensis]
MHVMLALFAVVSSGIAADNWGYGPSKSGVSGPDDWASAYPECKGQAQSPINIVTSKVTRVSRPFRYMKINFNNYNGGLACFLSNDGKTLDFKVRQGLGQAFIDDPVEDPHDRYQLETVRFHFGCNDWLGSEHAVDGRRHPGEIQMIFHNTKYSNVSDAADKSDGLLVVAAFMRKHPFWSSPAIKNLAKSYLGFGKVKKEGSVTPVFLIMEDLIKGIYRGMLPYYSYKGSQTAPACHESVRWIIVKQPVDIYRDEMAYLRRLESSSGKNGKLCDNFRPILYPLNGRTVYEWYRL